MASAWPWTGSGALPTSAGSAMYSSTSSISRERRRQPAEEKADARPPFSVAVMCRVLEVSRSGFYDWETREPSDHELSDAALAMEIETTFIASNRTYGAPRVHAWLARQGFAVARKRVARIMRQLGLVGEMGRRRVRTTVADAAATPSKDLVGRAFSPTEPDRTWCGDITYIATGEGWLYLATVIDLFSRRVIGWAMAKHMRAELVVDALGMAIATRGGHVDGVVFHSDRGCQSPPGGTGSAAPAPGYASRWAPPGSAGTTQQRRCSSPPSSVS